MVNLEPESKFLSLNAPSLALCTASAWNEKVTVKAFFDTRKDSLKGKGFNVKIQCSELPGVKEGAERRLPI